MERQPTQPTQARLVKHHDYRSWSSTWYCNQGRRRTKRFGREGELTRRQVERAYHHWLVNEWSAKPQVRNPDGEAARFTVEHLADRFEAHCEKVYVKDGRPTGTVPEARSAMQLLRNALGRSLAADVEARDVAALRDTLALSPVDGRPLSIRTANGRLQLIKAAFAHGREKGLMPRAVALDVASVPNLRVGRCDAKPRKAIRPVDRAAVDAVLPHLPKSIGAMIELLWLTGMRPGEVCSMRTCDLKTGEEVWTYQPHTHKTEHYAKERRVPIGPRAQEILRTWLRHQTTQPIFSPAIAVAERNKAKRAKRQTPVQPSQQDRRKPRPVIVPGEEWSETAFRRAIARACRKVDAHLCKANPKLTPGDAFPVWKPNQLRHSFATRGRALAGIEAVQAVLGHARLSTTEMYAERDWASAENLARRIG